MAVKCENHFRRRILCKRSTR